MLAPIPPGSQGWQHSCNVLICQCHWQGSHHCCGHRCCCLQPCCQLLTWPAPAGPPSGAPAMPSVTPASGPARPAGPSDPARSLVGGCQSTSMSTACLHTGISMVSQKSGQLSSTHGSISPDLALLCKQRPGHQPLRICGAKHAPSPRAVLLEALALSPLQVFWW